MRQVRHHLKLGLVILGLSAAANAQSDQDAQDAQEPQPDIIEPDADIERRAREAADVFRRKGMVDLIDQMGPRVRGVLGVTGDEQVGEQDVSHLRPNNSVRAILFASSSVPLVTLRAYAAQLEKLNGVIVFRGMPGGLSSMKPMISLTHKIILRDESCTGTDCDVFDVGVIVDPLMFRANGVDMVPAVTLVDHDPFAAYCERPTEAQAGSISDKVTFGDAHMSGHLEALTLLGDRRARDLLRLLNSERAIQ